MMPGSKVHVLRECKARAIRRYHGFDANTKLFKGEGPWRSL